ncbi:filamentous hemagglutinin N-terminal domain-containing protein [Leptolyngbya sp. 'hensonii']|uniref:two-partner secretion domain-containing protein n=1 Tax=Leptolyngbya sp. 'hensonii' TaxID=1922337 RepID=UPI001C0CAC40|nr:filamentous hemagglutinin N-terminal domain-containing protein [Leptolyngbya sp. 'hensonii']
MIKGIPSDRIEGGAVRGINVFHSFSQFSVGQGQGAYFATPAGVQNILSRVTGDTPSIIQGRLGVVGNANLFLVNPKGIVFGPNSSLDVTGSFVGTTASGIPLGDKGSFSASDPGSSNLLAVEPSAMFLNALQGTSGNITNQGTLATGKDLTLIGNNVTSTGALNTPNGQVTVAALGDASVRELTAQSALLQAGNNLLLQESKLVTAGNMTLLADNTVQIRDSVQTPFLAFSGGNMLIQGNQAVDILALNHPGTPFQSLGNMTLASNGPVSGDARYAAAGNFSIVNLAGQPGTFLSLYDPIISSTGNVEFGSYTGPSLKVEAAGSITVTGAITITGPDTTFGGDGVLQSTGNVTIAKTGNFVSSGTINNSSSSNSASSLEGYLSNQSGDLTGKLNASTVGGSNNGTPTTGSAIKLQFGVPLAVDDGTTVTPGKKVVSFDWTFSTSENTSPTNTFKDFAFYTVSGPDKFYLGDGPVPALADQQQNQAFTLANTASAIKSGTQAVTLLNNDTVNTATFSLGIGVMNVQDTLVNSTITVSGFKVDGAAADISVSGDPDVPTLGSSAALILKAGVPLAQLNLPNTSNILGIVPPPAVAPAVSSVSSGGASFTSTANPPTPPTLASIDITGAIKTVQNGSANGGPVILQAPGNITLTNAPITTGNTTSTQTGFVTIESTAGNITLTNSSIFTQPKTGVNSGGVRIETQAANGQILITNSTITTSASEAIGGKVEILANSNASTADPAIKIVGSTIDTAGFDSATNTGTDQKSRSSGVLISAPQSAVEICSTAACDGSGFSSTIYSDTFSLERDSTSGNIEIVGDTIKIVNYRLNAELTFNSKANGGSILIGNATTVAVEINKSTILTSVGSSAEGKGGDILVKGNAIQISNNSQLNASTASTVGATPNPDGGKGGKVNLQGEVITLDSAQINASTSGTKEGGAITLTTPNSGTIGLTNSKLLTTVNVGGSGKGGDVTLNSGTITLESGSQVNADTLGSGDGGVISIGDATTTSLIDIKGATTQVTTTVGNSASGKGGDIFIKGNTIQISSNAKLDASTASTVGVIPNPDGGKGGTIDLQGDSIALDLAQINASTSGTKAGGAITLTTPDTGTIDLTNSKLLTTVNPGASGQGGDVTLASGTISLKSTSEVNAATLGNGDPGLITITAPASVTVTDSTITAKTETSKNAGNIFIATGDLKVNGGGKINSESTNTGRAGTIQVLANSVQLGNPTGAGTLSVKATGPTGQGGVIFILAPQVTLQNGSQISASNIADSSLAPNSGIALFGLNTLELTDSEISASTETGQAGVVYINSFFSPLPAQSVTLINSTLSVKANGATGTAGDILLNTQNLFLDNSTILASIVDGDPTKPSSNLTVEAAGNLANTIELKGASSISLEATGNGKAGNITLKTQNLILTGNSIVEQSTIKASTGTGQAGNLSINEGVTPADSITLNNGTLSVAATGAVGNSTAGNIVLNTQTLDLQNNSEISTASKSNAPGSSAGFITSTANTLTLQGNSSITASTKAGQGGNITFTKLNILTAENSQIATATETGKAGNLSVNEGGPAATTIALDNATFSLAATGAVGNSTAGNIVLNTQTLGLQNNSEISTASKSNAPSSSAGFITSTANTLILQGNSSITASTKAGQGGNITFTKLNILTAENSQIATATETGKAGNLSVNEGGPAATTIALNNATFSLAATGATGNSTAGNIVLNTQTLGLQNNSEISTASKSNDFGSTAGYITSTANLMILQGNSSITASTIGGKGGNITFTNLNTLTAQNSDISTSTENGLSGIITIVATQMVDLNGPGGLFAGATGTNGTPANIQVTTPTLLVRNGAEIATSTLGTKSAGSISIQVGDTLELNGGSINSKSKSTGDAGMITIQSPIVRASGGEISAESQQGGGGQIFITAKDIRLRNSSPIISSVFDGTGNGGSILIQSYVFLALEDSDILANAEFGDGGQITINAPAFVADIFAFVKPNPGSLNPFRHNGRVDISASSRFGVSGAVLVPDFTFLQNSLTSLSENLVNPDEAISRSCQARQNATQGSFVITGTGGLVRTPYDLPGGSYPLSDLQPLQNPTGNPTTGSNIAPPEVSIEQPRREARGVSRTADGRVLLASNAQTMQIPGVGEVVCH